MFTCCRWIIGKHLHVCRIATASAVLKPFHIAVLLNKQDNRSASKLRPHPETSKRCLCDCLPVCGQCQWSVRKRKPTGWLCFGGCKLMEVMNSWGNERNTQQDTNCAVSNTFSPFNRSMLSLQFLRVWVALAGYACIWTSDCGQQICSKR